MIKEIVLGIIMFIDTDGIPLQDLTITTDNTPTCSEELENRITLLSDYELMDLDIK